MRIERDCVEELPWVDVFSESHFQGRMRRLRGSKSNGTSVITRPKLPTFRSIIVGPGTTAELARRGRPKAIKLSARTVLADTSRLTNGMEVQSVAVVCNQA